jgi:cysteine desulfurase
MKHVYLDHAATTYVDPEVLKAMMPYFSDEFGNPTAIYADGRHARETIETARDTVAEILNCKYDEVIFTGSGTESDNLAVFGFVEKKQEELKESKEKLHIITSKIEHHAVLYPFERLKKQGYKVTFLEVDKYGLIDPKKFKEALTPDTIFTSMIYANNEIGTIEPISELAKIAHSYKNRFGESVVFHTDACQAAGVLDINVKNLGVDLMTINGSKIYGPKGIGVLYKKSSIKIHPQIVGGGQENNMRSGTENVPGIIGFAKALELAQKNKEKENKRLTTLREKLIQGIFKSTPRTYLNGHPTLRLPNNANILFLDIEGEALLLHLDEKGIEVSTGSACNSKSLAPSHVLLATGLPHAAVHGSIRMTLGKRTTEEDIDYVLKVLPPIIKQLRAISPIHLDEKKLNR